MRVRFGKFQENPGKKRISPYFPVAFSFFAVEGFAFFFLSLKTPFEMAQLWPLAFGGLWAVILTGVLAILPGRAGKIGYCLAYFASVVYAGFQTGYYILFSQMMWLSDFRYAGEGADYADVLLAYPVGWWLGLLGLIALGVAILRFIPKWEIPKRGRGVALMLAVLAAVGAVKLPNAVFLQDEDIRYAGSDYGRAQSAEAAYENMFNAHRLYQVCGLYQTFAKDVGEHLLYPLTPAYASAQEEGRQEIGNWFAEKGTSESNAMTGLLQGKNVVLVLMESMDDWMIGQYTPTLEKLMEQSIQFTNFYTPGYGGIRTFNTEFCINTGSFLSSAGGYAFDYVTNTYNQSLANCLTRAGYSAKTFHYNTPTFYSRGEFSPAMGYEEYVCYADYLADVDEKTKQNLLYDDCLLFDNEALNALFFREGQPTLNFVITRSAHLSYKYNEVLSYWGLKRYPEFKGLTGNEETDCAYLKAKLVDDFFARLLQELEEKGQLENTVIIGVTDHYTYGYKDTASLLGLSGVTEELLLEKTPCFIWSSSLEPMEVDKVLNTADLLPTMLNLLGVEREYDYLGSDAFNESYDGFVPFSNGSWIYGDMAYDAKNKRYFSVSGQQQVLSAQTQQELAQRVQEFVQVNNRILDTDYYR